MKLNDVKIGGEYEARIAGGTMQVRILAEKASGGWTALNLETQKKAFVPLARQLREPDTTATTTTDGNDDRDNDDRRQPDDHRGATCHGRNDQYTRDQTCPEEEGHR